MGQTMSDWMNGFSLGVIAERERIIGVLQKLSLNMEEEAKDSTNTLRYFGDAGAVDEAIWFIGKGEDDD
jgi:hypothetical protein